MNWRKLILLLMLIVSVVFSNIVTIALNSTVSSNLANFPARVNIPTANLSSFLNATHCANIRFFDSDNTTELAFDVDYCDLSLPNITYWVRIPTLTPNKNIYAYLQPFGINNENVSGVWGPAGYVFVWHANNLSVDYGNTTGLEQIGSDCNFGPHNYCFAGKCVFVGTGNCYFQNLSSSGLPTGNSPGTQAIYVYMNQTVSTSGGLLSYGAESNNNARLFYHRPTPSPQVVFQPYGSVTEVTYSLGSYTGVGRWYHAIHNPTNISVGYNGYYSTVGSNWNTLTSGNLMVLAIRPGVPDALSSATDNFYADEARISSVARSSEWLLAEQRQTSQVIDIFNFSINLISPVKLGVNSSNVLFNFTVSSDSNFTVRLYINNTLEQTWNSNAGSNSYTYSKSLSPGYYTWYVIVNISNFNISSSSYFVVYDNSSIIADLNVANWSCSNIYCQFPLKIQLPSGVSNGSDIAFLNSDNQILSYWLQDDQWSFSGRRGVVWVNASNNTNFIRIIKAWISFSNIYETFIVGEDFKNASNYSAVLCPQTGVNLVVSNGVATISSTSNSYKSLYIPKYVNVGNTCSYIRVLMQKSGSNSFHLSGVTFNQTSCSDILNGYYFGHRYSYDAIYVYNSTYYHVPYNNAGYWSNMRLCQYYNGSLVLSIFDYGKKVYSGVSSSSMISDGVLLLNRIFDNGATAYVDYGFVYPYSIGMPKFSALYALSGFGIEDELIIKNTSFSNNTEFYERANIIYDVNSSMLSYDCSLKVNETLVTLVRNGDRFSYNITSYGNYTLYFECYDSVGYSVRRLSNITVKNETTPPIQPINLSSYFEHSILGKSYIVLSEGLTYQFQKVRHSNFEAINKLNRTYATLYNYFTFNGTINCSNNHFNGSYFVYAFGTNIRICLANMTNICFQCNTPIYLSGNYSLLYSTAILTDSHVVSKNVIPYASPDSYTGLFYNERFGPIKYVVYAKDTSFGVLNMTSEYSNQNNYPCRTLVVLGDNILRPEVMYDVVSQRFIPDILDPINNYVYLRNNSVSYLYDAESKLWYFTLPFICSPGTTYVISAYVYEQESEQRQGQKIQFPPVFLKKMCGLNGSNYVWDISALNNVFFEAVAKVGNTTAQNINTTSDRFTGSFSASYDEIIINADGYPICYHSNKLFTIFTPIELFDNELYKTFGLMLFVMTMAVSFFAPVASLGLIAVNDIFSLFKTNELFSLIVMLIVGSFFANTSHKRSMRMVGFYVGLFIVYVTWFLGTLAIDHNVSVSENFRNTFEDFSSSWTSFISSFSDTDLLGMLVGALNLLKETLIMILKLPFIIWNLLLYPLSEIHPVLYAAAANFAAVLTIGVGVYIVLTLYMAFTRVFIEL